MWAVFTRALTRSSSTTQVCILNTSANFLLTAILGLLVFSESLPPLWFVGAALLVMGNVTIGRRAETGPGAEEEEAASASENLESSLDEEETLLGTVDGEEDSLRAGLIK
jgi:hypothetical protein